MHQEFIELAAHVTRGILDLDRVSLKAALRRMADGDYVFSLKRGRAKRTLAQNNFWHGVVIPAFADHCGYDEREMKDVLALELIPREVPDLKTGEVRIVPGHTSELNVKAFNELIERAQRLGAEMGIVIPDPESRETRATTEAA